MATETSTSSATIQNRTSWYDWLAFSPKKEKNALWLSQFLFYAKMNSVRFLDETRCIEYRKLERLELDRQTYINLVDPPTPMGGGGRAEYFAADFKANPIDVHIDNIVRAKMDKICIENKLQVSEIDKFAKSQKQKDKDQLIYQREFRNLINTVQQELGLPPIKDSQTPYGYVKSLSKDKKEDMISSVDSLLDYIKSQIRDNQDIALYESYVYKGDIERAFELGITHYLVNLNKWHIKCEYFNNDLKNFNKACGRFYTDETNGRGTVEYLEPFGLYTSPFSEKNGEDIIYWFYEKNITFAEFIRQFGTTLTEQQLKEVFELNRGNGNHTIGWESAKTVEGSNAKIRIGQLSCLTQDANNFSEELIDGIPPSWQRKPLSWFPEVDNEKQVQKIYNVWYSCYYVPPAGGRAESNRQIDWDWQSQYIFNIHKDIDMYRYGVDMRYAKSTLVIWKDERPSYTDIKQAFMPKIHTTWHKFQNCLVQDTTAMAFSTDLINGLLNAVDEGNKINPASPEKPQGGNGQDAGKEAFKSVKQGGLAFFNFRDRKGDLIVDPNKLFVYIDSKHLDKAERLLMLIIALYNQMTLALAQNDLTEGANPTPRINEISIQASLAASANGIWYIEKPVREFFVMYGERTVQFILSIIKERKKYNYKQRWDEFSSVVGMANALMMEGIEDLQPEEIGITVSLEDVKAMQQYVIELANKMADDGEVGREVVGLVMNQVAVNYKYAYVLLMVAAKQRDREKADMEELAHQRQMQLGNQQLQIAKAMQADKTDNKIKELNAQGAIDAKLEQILAVVKTASQKDIKETMKNNKIEQDNNKFAKEQEAESQKAFSAVSP